MANTLIPIQTYTLSSTSTSITFSNIPQNYTDLQLVVSARTSYASDYNEQIQIQFNGDTSTSNYFDKIIYSYGTTIGAAARSGNAGPQDFNVAAATATANTFSNNYLYFPNYTNSSAKNFYFDVTVDSLASSTSNYMILDSGYWTGTAAITQIKLNTIQSGSVFAIGSTFTLYGISNGVKATGGTIICAGGYAYHTFTSTGSFLPNQQIKGAEVLAVAGGGGGGGFLGGPGGGGAGGIVYATSQVLNAGNTYTALVGSGGTGQTSSGTYANNGNNSVFSALTANGGGRGSGSGGPLAGTGGSGGGASEDNGTAGGTNQVSGTNYTGYGNIGGLMSGASATRQGGGGGGAGAAGGDAIGSSANAGNGGVGLSTWSSWGSVTGTGQNVSGVYYYAGGGGGGRNQSSGGGTGGYGGGGAGGSNSSGTAGTANTGGGGGAGSRDSYYGAAGGSGLIIVRYPLA